jgi:hypothetical protein
MGPSLIMSEYAIRCTFLLYAPLDIEEGLKYLYIKPVGLASHKTTANAYHEVCKENIFDDCTFELGHVKVTKYSVFKQKGSFIGDCTLLS